MRLSISGAVRSRPRLYSCQLRRLIIINQGVFDARLRTGMSKQATFYKNFQF